MVAQVDTDHWVNFLILVVMAILWLFGSLIKALSKKKSPQARPDGLAGAQRETWQQRLARKAEEIQRAAEERIRRMEERADVRERAEQPPRGKLTARSGRGGESILVYEQAESRADSTREQHAARQREAKEAVAVAGRSATVTPMGPKLETMGLDFQPTGEEPADVMLHPPQPLERGKEDPEARREPIGYEPGAIIDYADPDALKKAILHYEILGKSVGLRDPFDLPGTS